MFLLEKQQKRILKSVNFSITTVEFNLNMECLKSKLGLKCIKLQLLIFLF